jgi:hypothetical protein
MTIDQFHDELTRTLDGDCRLICSLDDPPTADALRSMQREVGMKLPPDFLAFQAKYGAAYVEVNEDVWPRPKAFAAGPFWSFQYGLVVLGIGNEVPDWLDIRVQAREFSEGVGALTPFELAPLFKQIASSDFVCSDKRGRLFFVSHETPDHPEAIDDDFLTYVLKEVRQLARNKARLRSELPQLFETDADRLAKRRVDAEKDAGLTNRRCPKCNSPCPTYRKTCKVCGFAVGRLDQ